jgi:hypothetical protein
MGRELPIVWTNTKDEKVIRENQGGKGKKGSQTRKRGEETNEMSFLNSLNPTRTNVREDDSISYDSSPACIIAVSDLS